MTVKTSRALVLLCLCLLFAWPAQAAETAKELQAIRLTGRLQGAMLYGMAAFDGQVLLGQALSATDSAFAEYESMLKELAVLSGVGRPGRERITKYYEMVLARDADITQQMNVFEKKMAQTGQADPEVSAQLALLAARYRYGMNELVRHVAATIDLAACSTQGRIQYAETLNFINLQRHLLLAIFLAYDANYPGAFRPAHEFWFSLGRFDYGLQMYKAFIQVAGLAASRVDLLAQLEKLKHEVVMTGEQLFIQRGKTGRPEPATVKALWKINEAVFAAFKGLLK